MHHVEKRELKERLRTWYLSVEEIPNGIKLHSLEASHSVWYWYLTSKDSFYYTAIKESNRTTLGKAMDDVFEIIKVLVEMKEGFSTPKKKKKRRKKKKKNEINTGYRNV